MNKVILRKRREAPKVQEAPQEQTKPQEAPKLGKVGRLNHLVFGPLLGQHIVIGLPNQNSAWGTLVAIKAQWLILEEAGVLFGGQEREMDRLMVNSMSSHFTALSPRWPEIVTAADMRRKYNPHDSYR
jgi:hypothetical protein